MPSRVSTHVQGVAASCDSLASLRSSDAFHEDEGGIKKKKKKKGKKDAQEGGEEKKKKVCRGSPAVSNVFKHADCVVGVDCEPMIWSRLVLHALEGLQWWSLWPRGRWPGLVLV